ncbi:MAG: DUF6775 family putative metallopeptidase, partial [bacterium]
MQKFVSELGVECEIKGNLYGGLGDDELDVLARRLAEIRVLDSDKEDALNPNPFPVEVQFEKRSLLSNPRKPGVVYSEFEYAAQLRGLSQFRGLSPSLPGTVPVVITTQRVATWGGDRWHLRTTLLTIPVIISISGLVEAPARDREYYLLKQADKALGDQWLERSRDAWLDYGDARIADVLKGYLYQALFWAMNPAKFEFCDDPECALYNSHWQREMLAAQLRHVLCPAHAEKWNLIRA